MRVQSHTRWQLADGSSVPLPSLITRGGRLPAQGRVFKKAGWLPVTLQLIWEQAYATAWCLVTNCSIIDGRLYARRYWQEPSCRDLKSAGWQWQASHSFTPHPANQLLLVLAVAYAWVLALATLAFEAPALASRVVQPAYSLFRMGLRLIDAWGSLVFAHLASLALPPFVCCPPLALKPVGP